MSEATNIINKIIDNMEKVIVGKREACEQVVCALLCNGHVLIEDVPGVGKTSLVSALSKSLSLSFKRIQFTPDILPSDITGFTMFNQKSGDFVYSPGLIMANLVLADEINRTSPKTQSSLLEVMEEGFVTVDGVSHPVPKPFMVLATQNPVEYLGTYPLPEAQIDRFFIKITLGYPTKEQESRILSLFREQNPMTSLFSVVEKVLTDKIVDIVHGTRNHGDVALGVSPRGSLALSRGAQAWALMKGRDYVTPDDIKYMAVPVLSHRIMLKQEAKLKKVTQAEVVKEALARVKFVD